MSDTTTTLDPFASGTLDLDLLLDPTSGTEQVGGELSFDFSLESFDLPVTPQATTTSSSVVALASGKPAASAGLTPSITIVEDISSACSPTSISMSGGNVLAPSSGDLVNMNNMDHFYSTQSTSSAAAAATSMSSLPMTSIASRGFHPLVTQFHQPQHQSQSHSHITQHQHHQPLLAPKQHTPPSSSVSPALSHIHTFDIDPSIHPSPSANTAATTSTTSITKKRSRAESTGFDLSSNNSAQEQDSEEERIVEKRRRNTMAARRFRKRKQDHVSDLESQLNTVTKERDDLKLQVAKWEGEVMALRKLLEMKK